METPEINVVCDRLNGCVPAFDRGCCHRPSVPKTPSASPATRTFHGGDADLRAADGVTTTAAAGRSSRGSFGPAGANPTAVHGDIRVNSVPGQQQSTGGAREARRRVHFCGPTS